MSYALKVIRLCRALSRTPLACESNTLPIWLCRYTAVYVIVELNNKHDRTLLTLQCYDVYSVLDAFKAFDRVKYSKLFHCLLDRKLSATFIRLLLSLYTGHVVCVLWNGVYSCQFPVKNGVKQGSLLSPALFCVFIDGLLNRLAKCHVGCYIGLNFLGAPAYADDIILLAPTPSANS